jgi:iron(III) transport system substrate-binding protein
MRVLGLIVLVAALGPLGTAGASEVVAYTARHYGQEPAIEAFTKKFGIQVKLLACGTGELFERRKAEGENPPADVLLTVDAGNLWHAPRAGVLSKIDSLDLASNGPASLRDSDNRWFGLTLRARTIMYNTGKVKPAELSTYEALINIASAGEFQAATTRLADRAGYK